MGNDHGVGRRRLARVSVLIYAFGSTAGFSQPADPASYPSASEWRQWGGPHRNFVSDSAGLSETWPASGPKVLWSRPLGLGHSSIVADEGRLFTLYRAEASRAGSFEAEESVIALSAATGKTIWEHKYPSEPLNFRYGAGPHATPLVVEGRVFTAGTNKQIFAFAKATGEVIWSHDLVKDFGAPKTLIRPPVKAGYACSPIAYKDTIILSAGGAGQSVMALRQSDGSVVWKSGDFLIAEASPILIDVGGEKQLIVVGGQTVNGLDPDTGKLLWSHAHDTDSDMNNSMPVWGADNVLFVTSAYNGGSRALRVTRQGGGTKVEELWFTNRLRIMFGNAIRVGDYVYGSSGDFGPALVTALDIRTGQVAWQERGFGRSSFVYADGKLIIMDEDGSLAIARVSPEGLQVLSKATLFDTTSWTAPTLVGKTLYARDRKKIVALDLGR